MRSNYLTQEKTILFSILNEMKGIYMQQPKLEKSRNHCATFSSR